ncbi:MAG: SCO family protein [Alphaproteobacteria bacterium]|nr:SCO family protein [Alphaproteobacteria bacterium]MBV8548575.1 SCO family protein [Alphaproteobacteria bacterium]
MRKLFRKKISDRFVQLAEKRALQTLIVVALGILMAGFLVVWQAGKDRARVADLQRQAAQVTTQTAVPPGTGAIGGSFSLTNQDGTPVTDAAYKGKLLLVYFGYTYCPDLCPTGLQSISKALDHMQAEEVAKVQPLFITIDPARDTPQKLKEYISSFHPAVAGLTGTAQQIADVAKKYQVYYARGEQVDEHDYVMDHSSLIYLMGTDGQLVQTFSEEADPDHIIQALRKAFAK